MMMIMTPNLRNAETMIKALPVDLFVSVGW